MISILNTVSALGTKKLMRTMHVDRAHQFSDRLNWNVHVEENGEEYDEYDLGSPTYLVVMNECWTHLASMRLRPFSGPTMVCDHFQELIPNSLKLGLGYWECTRFCVSSRIQGKQAKLVGCVLLNTTYNFAIQNGIKYGLGLFDDRMPRIYSSLGWCPKILSRGTFKNETINLGIWETGECHKSQLQVKLLHLSNSVVCSHPIRAVAVKLDNSGRNLSDANVIWEN